MATSLSNSTPSPTCVGNASSSDLYSSNQSPNNLQKSEQGSNNSTTGKAMTPGAGAGGSNSKKKGSSCLGTSSEANNYSNSSSANNTTANRSSPNNKKGRGDSSKQTLSPPVGSSTISNTNTASATSRSNYLGGCGSGSTNSSSGGSYGSHSVSQQNALIQSASLAGYPMFYPNTFHLGFPPPPTSTSGSSGCSTYGGSGYGSSSNGLLRSDVGGPGIRNGSRGRRDRSPGGARQGSSNPGGGSGNGGQNVNQSSANSRRGGKKKQTGATQSHNPEFRLFLSIRRRDAAVAPNKGQSHVYKPKNPPTLQEWFKRLTPEERVNSLTTVCPHLTDTFMSMFHKIDRYGHSYFARHAPSSSLSSSGGLPDHKYFAQQSPYHQFPHHPYSGLSHFFPHGPQQQDPYMFSQYPSSSSNNSSTGGRDYAASFEDLFYHRQPSEAEYLSIRNSERAKIDAEQEVLRSVRLTDYFAYLDTFTVTEELVQDPDHFFKLMSKATNNQAFSCLCHFENKSSTSISIEQPAWFRPKSFHSFATWVIVALEENLWAHYNLDNSANQSASLQVKPNELASLFIEKSDMGAQDIDITQLSQYWRDLSDKNKKSLTDQLKQQLSKEPAWCQDINEQAGGGSKQSKVVQSKNMSYMLQIKDRSTSAQASHNSTMEAIESEIRQLLFESGGNVKHLNEMELLHNLVYSTFEKASQKQVVMNRSFLELIKKKYKDDLMDNLLQEEYSKSSPSTAQSSNQSTTKVVKKKKKKNTTAQVPEGSIQSAEENVKTASSASLQAIENSELDTRHHQIVSEEVKSNKGTLPKKKNPKQAISKQPNETPSRGSLIVPNNANGKSSTNNRNKKKKNNGEKQNNATSLSENVNKIIAAKGVEENSNQEIGQINPDNADEIIKEESKQLLETTESGRILEGDLQNSHSDYSTSRERSQEHENIQRYVFEITNQLITEVCRRAELDSPQRSPYQLDTTMHLNVVNPLIHSSLAPQSTQHKQTQPIYQRKSALPKQNETPDALGDQLSQSNSLRKRSFNVTSNTMSPTYQQKRATQDKVVEQQHRLSGTSGELTEHQMSENPKSQRKYSNQQESKPSEIPRRKGFGIHLKSNHGSNQDLEQFKQRKDSFHSGANSSRDHDSQHAWAKGTAIKSDPSGPTQTKKKHQQHHHKPPQPQSQLNTVYKTELENTINQNQTQEHHESALKSESSSKQQSSEDQSSIVLKKKRNKKKTKLTGAELMNSFMKSLQAQPEEESKDKSHNLKKPSVANPLPSNATPATLNNKKVTKQPHPTTKAVISNETINQSVTEDGEKQKSAEQQVKIQHPKQQQINRNSNNQQRGGQNNNYGRRYTEDQKDSIITVLDTQPVNQQEGHPVSKKTNNFRTQNPSNKVSNDFTNNFNQKPYNKFNHRTQHHNHHLNQNEITADHEMPICNNEQSNLVSIQPPITNTSTIQESAVEIVDYEVSQIKDESSQMVENVEILEQSNNNPEITLNVVDEIKVNHNTQDIQFEIDSSIVSDNGFARQQDNINHAVDTSLDNSTNLLQLPHQPSNYQQQHSKYQSYQNTPSKTLNYNSKVFVHKGGPHAYQSNAKTTDHDQEHAHKQNNHYRTPPQHSKKQQVGHQNPQYSNHYNNNQNYQNNASGGQYNNEGDGIKKHLSAQNSTHHKQYEQGFNPVIPPFTDQNQVTNNTYSFPYYHQQPSPFEQLPPPGPQQPAHYNSNYSNNNRGQHHHHNNNLTNNNHHHNYQGMKPRYQTKPHYNQHNRTNNGMPHSARNLLNNQVYIQPMNLSQSMQEQMNELQDNSNGNESNLNGNANINTAADTFTPKMVSQNSLNEPVCFPYFEKSQSTHVSLGASLTVQTPPVPCYSPQGIHFSQQPTILAAQGEHAMPKPFNYYNARAPSTPMSLQQPQQYLDQSQDLIFQIFNSIKSNHSMSPIPQIMSPPPMLDFHQISLHQVDINTANHYQGGNYGAQRLDSVAFNHQEAQFYDCLDQDIAQYVDQVKSNINLMKPERDYVLNKIQEVASRVFSQEAPKIEIFGSLITGLALESSDMDIAVTGLRIEDRFAMVDDLCKLADALRDWKCLSSFKSIDTASIPVIKMKIDLQLLRNQEMPEREERDFEQRPIPDNQRYLSVDITFDDSQQTSAVFTPNSLHHMNSPFQSHSSHGMMMGRVPSDIMDTGVQTKTHLGLQSCALVQYYIANYKNLKQVSILLKQFLAIHNFNSPYYGGLSSYSTVVLIVAYMNYYGLKTQPHHNGMILPQDDMSPSRLLMGFLDFYGNYFNPGSMGISVHDDGSFFQVHSMQQDSNFVILDPLNLQNNTTKNSYLTKDILQKFKCVFNNLKSLMHQLPSLQQQASLSSQTLFSIANQQDKKSPQIPLIDYLQQQSSILNPQANPSCFDEQHSNKDSSTPNVGDQVYFKESPIKKTSSSDPHHLWDHHKKASDDNLTKTNTQLQTILSPVKSQSSNGSRTGQQCHGPTSPSNETTVIIDARQPKSSPSIGQSQQQDLVVGNNIQAMQSKIGLMNSDTCSGIVDQFQAGVQQPRMRINLLDTFFSKDMNIVTTASCAAVIEEIIEAKDNKTVIEAKGTLQTSIEEHQLAGQHVQIVGHQAYSMASQESQQPQQHLHHFSASSHQ